MDFTIAERKQREKFFKSKFFIDYKEQMLTNLKNLFPEMSEKYLLNKIKVRAEKEFKDTKCMWENTLENTITEMKLSDVIDFVYEKEPILTGNGFFMKKEKSLESKMLMYLLDLRKKYKATMFSYINTDKILFQAFNSWQLSTKEMTNSYYGVLGERNSQFYDKYLGPAVTLSGFNIISTAVLGYESMFGNTSFECFDDLVQYINRVTDVELEEDEVDKLLMKGIEIMGDEELTNLMMEKLPEEKFDEESDNIVYNLILTKNNKQKFHLMMANDFYRFIEIPHIKKLLVSLAEKDMIDFDKNLSIAESIDSNEAIDEKYSDDEIHTVSIMNTFWNYLKRYVNRYELYQNSKWKVKNEIRKSVLTIDTDSTLVYLDPFWQYMKRNSDIEGSREERISLINFMVFICTKFIKDGYSVYTKNANIPKEVRWRTAMKNEFLIDRIFLTPNKKSYAMSIIAIEGNILETPKIEFKGLQIKKSTVNPKTRKFFQDLVEEEFMAKEIDLSKIFGKIFDYQELIREEIRSGKKSFAKLTTNKANNSYKYPFRMQVVRGRTIWNALYPGDPILSGDKCGIYKLNPIEDEEALNEKNIPEDVKEIIKKEVFENEEMSHYGFDVISFPVSDISLPEWLSSLVKVDEIVDDNIRNGIILLRSLGLEPLTVRGSTYISNIIDI